MKLILIFKIILIKIGLKRLLYNLMFLIYKIDKIIKLS